MDRIRFFLGPAGCQLEKEPTMTLSKALLTISLLFSTGIELA